MAHKIIDDFLPEAEFKAIQEYFLSPKMPWYYNDHVVYGDGKKDKNQYQFVHILYLDDLPRGLGIQPVQAILDKLEILALLRVKVNFQPVRTEHFISGNHFDNIDFTKNDIPYTVGVFYLNDNNGSTHIGKKPIMSKANRMVLFSGDTEHAGCSATDEPRVVLNFNFINAETKSLYDGATR